MSEPVLLEVTHETRYDYAAPVVMAEHLAYLAPLNDARQQALHSALHIEPAPAARRAERDLFGNRRECFSLTQPHRALCVRASSRVALQPRAPLHADASPPWSALAQRLRYSAQGVFDAASEFAQPSPLLPGLPALRDYAAPCFDAGAPVAQVAITLMQRIHADFEFSADSTEVDTPLAQAFAQRRGVCQDFAHLMIAALRAFGLPARYVSGYLLTTPPPGQAPMLGADASHAWVQLYCPDTPGVADGWLDLDPTNDLLPDTGHVRLAVGRDYSDVTPLRGVIRGGGAHTLAVRVHTRRVDAAQPIA